ncbi:uncharacterized protein BKCO1_2500022 [Diplodia corticola]|uniref:Integral membrane protein n=1 Tax=Diplodia corticola TaxID=236234 RepID=A0A1J9R1L8_9PEZI|nr:uncharacterized protein BKCO1_2500022 [Diplodia corticola]OJD34138.1 integral membrane protein [Diplodia corticola]
MPLPTTPLLHPLATLLATIPILFGLNAFLRPSHALSFFAPFADSYASPAASPQLLDALMAVYGARDVFMGVAVLVPLWSGSRKVAGAIGIIGEFFGGSMSSLAGLDGLTGGSDGTLRTIRKYTIKPEINNWCQLSKLYEKRLAFFLVFIWPDAAVVLHHIEDRTLWENGNMPMKIKNQFMDDCTSLPVAVSGRSGHRDAKH